MAELLVRASVFVGCEGGCCGGIRRVLGRFSWGVGRGRLQKFFFFTPAWAVAAGELTVHHLGVWRAIANGSRSVTSL